MNGMRYMITLKDGKIPEMAFHVENYHKHNLILFFNEINGAFALPLEEGKSRLELVDKSTTETFDASNDSYLIVDLLDALQHVKLDSTSLMKRYFKTNFKPSPIKENE